MRPIETTASNFNYGAPAGVKDCDPMPATRTGDGRVITVWEPTAEERQAIANGQNIEVHIWMQPPPMSGLQLTGLREVPDGEKRCLRPGPANP